MTNHSSFELENNGHACYFALAAWLSNLCHGFNNPLGTFSSKLVVSTKMARTFENQGRGWEKNGSRVKV